MSDEELSAVAAIVAYQDVTLTELRGLFDQIDFDLADVLEREAGIRNALDDVDSEFDDIRARLASLGVSVRDAASEAEGVAATGDVVSGSGYGVPLVPADADFDKLAALAEARLGQLGVDLQKDPLEQVLPQTEIARSLRAYSDQHGDISWDEADWVVVISAGLLATLLDIVLARTPKDIKLRSGREHPGSPLTRWLNENSKSVHEGFLKGLERHAKVPYDARYAKDTGHLVSGMSTKNHRSKSPGHDPILSFFYGVRDLMDGHTATYFDAGSIVRVPTQNDPVELIEAFGIVARHLLSDVATPAGLPAPLFTLFQLVDSDSPFVRTINRKEVQASWADIAKYMYMEGYDLRHFFTMGMSPGLVSALIWGYWFGRSYVEGGTSEQRRLEKAKLASMLLVGHSIATSGNLLKTGLIYEWNPLALNYAQILAMVPVATACFAEAAARDHRISEALEREWQALLSESGGNS